MPTVKSVLKYSESWGIKVDCNGGKWKFAVRSESGISSYELLGGKIGESLTANTEVIKGVKEPLAP